MSQIMNYVGYTNRSKFRNKYIKPLLEYALEMTEPDKPNSRNQKYKSKL